MVESAGPAAAHRRAIIYFPGWTAHGGAEHVTLRLANSLAALGYATTIATDANADSTLEDAVASEGVSRGRNDVRRLRTPRLPARVSHELRRLVILRSHARQLRRMKADVFINAQYRNQLPGCGATNVYYCHFPHRLGVPTRNRTHAAYLGAMSVLERFVIDRDREGFLGTYGQIWANSNYTAAHVAGRWTREASVLYPPCPSVAMRPKERIIASVGRFQAPGVHVPYKAQDTMIDAFAKLTSLHAEGWRLVLAGGYTADDAHYVEQLKARATSLPVDFLMGAPRQDVESLLGRASLYWHAQGHGENVETHPEAQEHFGISVVEAMSAGAIPIVPAAGGPAEIVGSMGGAHTWRTVADLRATTLDWVNGTERELDRARTRCVARAKDFSPAAFDRRLQELLMSSAANDSLQRV